MNSFARIGAGVVGIVGVVGVVGIALMGCERKEGTSTPATTPETEVLSGDGSEGIAPDTAAAPAQPDAAGPAQPEEAVQDVKAQVEKAAEEAIQEVEKEVEEVTAEAKSMMTGYIGSLQELVASVTSVDSALSAASQSSSIKGLLDTVKSSSAQFDALSPGVQDQLKQLFAGQLGPLKTQFADQLSRLEGNTMYAGIATMLKEVSLP